MNIATFVAPVDHEVNFQLLADIFTRFIPDILLDHTDIHIEAPADQKRFHEISDIGIDGIRRNRMNAVRAGYRVLFANTKDLVDRLYESTREGTLLKMLKELDKIPLLIVDELEYSVFGIRKINIQMFFRNRNRMSNQFVDDVIYD